MKSHVSKSETEICDRITRSMRSQFGNDEPRINHALMVLGYAEEILAEQGGRPLVVKAAAILHDIGIHEAERKHGSCAGVYQEIEGPPIARKIMEGAGMDELTIAHVCRIVGSHHSAVDIDTKEFRIIWDADWMVNIPDELKGAGKDKLKDVIDKIFKTITGKEIAYREFIGNNLRAPLKTGEFYSSSLSRR